MQASNEREALFKIRHLKQYFPLKKRGLFVKANDDISLDIYTGETLGLVGESGCGKSTLGRVLIQLYQQTEGKTMYYGRNLASLAPRYVQKTIQNIEKRIGQMKELDVARDKAQDAYQSMAQNVAAMGEAEKSAAEVALYELQSARDDAARDAHRAYLDIVQIFGGFMVLADVGPAKAAYAQLYAKTKERCDLQDTLADLQLDLRDVQGDIEINEEKGKATEPLQGKAAKLNGKIAQKNKEIQAKTKEFDAAQQLLQEMRAAHAGDAQFDQAEKMRDDGIDLARLEYAEMRQLRNDIQMIFQDPYSSLNARMTVGQIIGEGLLAHRFFKKNDAKMQKYVMQIMEDCGLSSYMIHRYPHQFSGGQRQRIGIARSLALHPRFVICDEAVSALDVSIQSQVINLLQDLREKDNLTYLFISHDLSVVKYISDRIGVMYLGNIVELTATDELFAHTMHPYTEALLSAIPTTDVDVVKEVVLLEGDIPSPINPPKGCKFHTRCRYVTDICKIVTPELDEVKPGHFVACHHKIDVNVGAVKEG